MTKTSVFIADNHLLVREGIKGILSGKHDLDIMGEATCSSELKSALKQTKPQILILDYHEPGYFSLEDIQMVRTLSPDTRVLVISTDHNKIDILRALEYGVTNYILKECNRDEFIGALYAAIRKEKFFCSKVIDAIVDKHFPKNDTCEPSNLSGREVEIIRLISEGLTNKKIAAKLFLSVHTVSTHRKNVLNKLKLNNSSELVAFAIKNGIIQVTPDKA
jgi:DNA-binding NarL/FixJ family response regulator